MKRPLLISAILAFTFLLLILPMAHAADIELSDSCSLADAIKAANTDAAVGDCPAGGGADTISFSGNITLSAALPHISSDVSIEGNDYTVSGKNRFRILAVNGGNLTVTNLTMTNGKADWGGAIANVNGGTLSINDSTVSRSRATEGGAIGNDGTLSISNSDLVDNSADNGGAIHNIGGTLHITGGSINRNASKDFGGAIYSEVGSLYIKDTAFRQNRVAERSGGGIYSKDHTRTVSGATFVANTSELNGGAISADRGSIMIEESTFERNSSDRARRRYFLSRLLTGSRRQQNHRQQSSLEWRRDKWGPPR